MQQPPPYPGPQQPGPPYPGSPHPGTPYPVAWTPPVGPHVGWAIGLWVLAGLTAIGTAFCTFMTVYGFWFLHHMDEEGVSTTAVVTRVDGGAVDVRYTVRGDETEAELFWSPVEDLSTGDEIEVVYDPDDVTYVVPEGSDGDRYLAIGFAVATGVGLLVVVGAVVGAVVIHRVRSRRLKARAPAPPGW